MSVNTPDTNIAAMEDGDDAAAATDSNNDAPNYAKVFRIKMGGRHHRHSIIHRPRDIAKLKRFGIPETNTSQASLTKNSTMGSAATAATPTGMQPVPSPQFKPTFPMSG